MFGVRSYFITLITLTLYIHSEHVKYCAKFLRVYISWHCVDLKYAKTTVYAYES